MRGRKPTVSDREIVSTIENADGPVASTAEVADEIGLSTRGTWTRLDRLHDENLINKKDAGGSSVWWVTTEGGELLEDRDGAETE